MTTTLNAITLPNDLQWTDEFAPRVIQQSKTTIDGSPHISAVALSKGLPITLKSWANGAFTTRATVLQLQALAAQPGLIMPLVLRGAQFNVMFRHHEGQAFSAAPVRDIANPGADELYTFFLSLITI